MSLRTICVLCSFVAALPLAAAPAPAPVLEKVIVLQRHGVRSPTDTVDELSKFSEQKWPSWPVAPGILAPNGEAAMRMMGTYLRSYYAQRGLFGANGCPAKDAAFVWADNADQRTKASGTAVTEGMFPGCGMQSRYFAGAGEDPVFHNDDKVCRPDAQKARAAILAKAKDLNALGPDFERGRAAMARIMAPKASQASCAKSSTGTCLFVTGKNTLSIASGEVEIDGPLATGSTFSENLLLEYTAGFPAADVGWGRANEAALADVLNIHNIYADLVRRTPEMAASNGAFLAKEIALFLRGMDEQYVDAPPVPAQAKFVLFMGHDTNLSNLSGMLDAVWALPGQPDVTAPDTALAFEVWRGADGKRTVKLTVHYQTLAQFRAVADKKQLAAMASSVTTNSRACGNACTVETIAARLENTLNKACIRPK